MSHPKDQPSGQKAVSPRRLALGLMKDMHKTLKSAVAVWGWFGGRLFGVGHSRHDWHDLWLLATHLQDAAGRLAAFSAEQRDKPEEQR